MKIANSQCNNSSLQVRRKYIFIYHSYISFTQDEILCAKSLQTSSRGYGCMQRSTNQAVHSWNMTFLFHIITSLSPSNAPIHRGIHWDGRRLGSRTQARKGRIIQTRAVCVRNQSCFILQFGHWIFDLHKWSLRIVVNSLQENGQLPQAVNHTRIIRKCTISIVFLNRDSLNKGDWATFLKLSTRVQVCSFQFSDLFGYDVHLFYVNTHDCKANHTTDMSPDM